MFINIFIIKYLYLRSFKAFNTLNGDLPSDQIIMETFGKRTVLLRKKLGLTQKEFAKAADFSQSNLSLLENDGVIPNLSFVMKIAESFPKVRLDWWITERGTMFIPEEEIQDDTDFGEISNPSLRKFLRELKDSVTEVKKVNNNTMSNISKRRKNPDS